MSESVAAIGSGLATHELDALLNATRRAFDRIWPEATAVTDGDFERAWEVAIELGLTDFGEDEMLPLAILIQGELGQRGLPLPIVDAALTANIAGTSGDLDTVAGIANGSIRPVIVHASLEGSELETVRSVEAGGWANRLVVLDDQTGKAAQYDLTRAARTRVDGLPRPAWYDLDVQDPPLRVCDVPDALELCDIRRLGLGARLMGAVERSSDLALEFATQRRQFGRTVGSYQAVSHRIVNAHIAITSAEELLTHALELRAHGNPEWKLGTEIYVQFVAERAAGLQFDAHHTLAATGYFEEHEAPWLFRRMHADLASMAALPGAVSVGDLLVDSGASLPDYSRKESARKIKEEVLEAFSPWDGGPPSNLNSWDDDARAVMKQNDWIGVGWPKEVGGRGWPVHDVIAFSEALAYSSPPLGNILMGINSIAPMIIESGTPHLRDLVLSEVRQADLSIALGYSEPGAGSDLASLRTSATKTKGGWVVSGQKLWGTCFQDSKWVVLAARTDPKAEPRQAGISLFLVDTDSPGISVSPHTSLSGGVSATTFWDEVFVPDDRLIGEEGNGWNILMGALASERVLIGSSVSRAQRIFDRLIAHIRNDPELVINSRRETVRNEVSRLAVRLQAARSLVNRAVRTIVDGTPPGTDASIAKIAATELAEDLNSTAIALLGPASLRGWGSEHAAGDGFFEDGVRSSIMGVIAGGTGDIQRNIVAHSIGLPRS